jgi:hypothetical protein
VQTRVAGDPTTQVHNVQTRVTGLAVHSTPAVTVMSAPHAANAPVLTPENGPHVADVQRAEQLPSLFAVTEHGSDLRAAGTTLGGTAASRASSSREVVAEDTAGAVTTEHGSDGRVTFDDPVTNRGQEEAALRATIAMAQLQLSAITGNETRHTSPSADRPGPTVSILRNGLREIPPLRQTPMVSVPAYPYVEKDLNIAGIYAMAKLNAYSGPISGERSTKHLEKFTEFKFNVVNTVNQFTHSDTLRLKYQCAIAHLTGDAKQLIIKWSAKNQGSPALWKIYSNYSQSSASL